MRSTARAHLSQLIEMFGTDGCLRIDTTPPDPEPDDLVPVSRALGGSEPWDEEEKGS